jgi:sirohydrochlorin cobaltochelatase
MQKMYPETPIYVGTVEGFPQLPSVIPLLKKTGKKKIILKPFMIVAGDHARNDMAGPEEDSWKNILEKEGFEVTPVINGLGESNTFADIYISHLEDAAKAAGINLK